MTEVKLLKTHVLRCELAAVTHTWTMAVIFMAFGALATLGCVVAMFLVEAELASRLLALASICSGLFAWVCWQAAVNFKKLRVSLKFQLYLLGLAERD